MAEQNSPDDRPPAGAEFIGSMVGAGIFALLGEAATGHLLSIEVIGLFVLGSALVELILQRRRQPCLDRTGVAF
jgi:hypothetical protein